MLIVSLTMVGFIFLLEKREGDFNLLILEDLDLSLEELECKLNLLPRILFMSQTSPKCLANIGTFAEICSCENRTHRTMVKTSNSSNYNSS